MKKKILKGLWSTFVRNINKFMLGIIMIVILIVQYHMIFDKPEPIKNKYGLQESFDLTTIPTGLLIWSHGVPGSEADFKHSPRESTRYYYFDLAILTKNKTIHVVRVPYYVIALLNPNGRIDFRGEMKKDKKKGNIFGS